MSEASQPIPETTPLDMAQWLDPDAEYPNVSLTAWEDEFVADVLEILRAKGTLTPKQREKLEDIYEEYQAKAEFSEACDDDD